jgi:GDP-4-dehydro-6-deoxy-D-mannose reductase
MPKSSPTILITGGTGFAGSHLVEALLAESQDKVHVTSYGSDSGLVDQVLPEDHIHQLNLTDFDKTKQLIKELRPNQIYHLAALSAVGSSFEQINKVLTINTQIQLSLLQAAKEETPKARILTIGSALEYQPQSRPIKETDPLGPVSPYAVSKVTQDMLAYFFYKHHDLPIIRARSFNHIGERQAPGFVVPDFCLQIARIEQSKQEKIIVGNLEAVRDFSDVKDVVQAYILLMNKAEVGQVYNIGSGQGVTIQKILDTLISLAKTEIEYHQDPNKYRPVEVDQVIADNNKIKQLGWKPQIKLKETLKRTLDYYRTRI